MHLWVLTRKYAVVALPNCHGGTHIIYTTTMQLFPQETISLPLSPENFGQLTFWPNCLAQHRADEYLRLALDTIPWQSDSIVIAGKTIPLPRLHCWFSEPAAHYEWSGITMTARTFPPWLNQIRLILWCLKSESGYHVCHVPHSGSNLLR